MKNQRTTSNVFLRVPTPERAARRANSLAAHVPRVALAVLGVNDMARHADRRHHESSAGVRHVRRALGQLPGQRERHDIATLFSRAGRQ